MGKKGREIVKNAGLNPDELIKKLNKAYCDEWLAYYQYWMGAQLVYGIGTASLLPELKEHAQDELKHAGMLAKRILELGGTPALSPEEWSEQSNCGYLAPKDPDSRTILEQNIQGERCAIEVYADLLEYIKGKDMITGNMIRKILEDEVEHEQDLEDVGLNIQDVTTLCTCKKK